jgi:hypothetical protein
LAQSATICHDLRYARNYLNNSFSFHRAHGMLQASGTSVFAFAGSIEAGMLSMSSVSDHFISGPRSISDGFEAGVAGLNFACALRI